MQSFQSVLHLQNAVLTPWQADTLWGHLCWHLAHRCDTSVLRDFLDLYRAGEPPILLSDGFPADLLPRPLLPPGYGAAAMRITKAQRLETARNAKKLAKAAWLTSDEFSRMRRGEAVVPSTSAEDLKSLQGARVVSRNWVNRLTNTAGSPFDLGEIYQRRVTVYWKVAPGYEDTVRNFLDDLHQGGYGKRKSIGYGAVGEYAFEACDDFAPVPDADAFVTLSRFVPAVHDPTDGFWNVAVKYGKLGEEWATSDHPFKQPLLQLECGSCFRTGGAPRAWYGHLVENIHHTRSEVVHYGFAFAVPMKLASPPHLESEVETPQVLSPEKEEIPA